MHHKHIVNKARRIPEATRTISLFVFYVYSVVLESTEHLCIIGACLLWPERFIGGKSALWKYLEMVSAGVHIKNAHVYMRAGEFWCNNWDERREKRINIGGSCQQTSCSTPKNIFTQGPNSGAHNYKHAHRELLQRELPFIMAPTRFPMEQTK
jgi:hypothetical protein